MISTRIEHLQPILNNGITMHELRRRIGSERGKDWKSMLSNVAQYIVGLKRQRVSTKRQYAQVQNEFMNNCGSIVISMGKIPANNDGTMPEQWENMILCSNPRGSSRGSPLGTSFGSSQVVQGVVNNPGQVLQGTSRGTSPVVNNSQQIVPGVVQGTQPANPDDDFDLYDAFLFIELLRMTY